MRILEIGAGTGGLASQVLSLLERGLHSYIFSDVSAAFFSGAAQKLAAFPEVEFKIFDLEKPGADQELETDAFDFIIGTNVLHAVSDVRAALRNLHGLLAPGGSLIFMDTATPQLWTETVFGLTSGWWRFTDRDLRPEQPLLRRAQWETVLRETGFTETTSLPGLDWPDRRRRSGRPAGAKVLRRICDSSRSNEARCRRRNRGSFSRTPRDSVTAWLRGCAKIDARCRVVRQADRFGFDDDDCFSLRPGALEDWQKLIDACADSPPERIVYLWSLDAQVDDMAVNLDALLHLTQVLESARPAAKLRSDLVTRNAQAAGRDSQPTAWRRHRPLD